MSSTQVDISCAAAVFAVSTETSVTATAAHALCGVMGTSSSRCEVARMIEDYAIQIPWWLVALLIVWVRRRRNEVLGRHFSLDLWTKFAVVVQAAWRASGAVHPVTGSDQRGAVRRPSL